jgi:hypothetical protein
MIRALIRPSYRWVLLLCLALVPACGKQEPAKPAPALTQAQAASLRQQVEDLRQQAMDLSSQITQLRREHMEVMSELTTQTQRLAASLNSIDGQLGGKPIPLAIRPVAVTKGTPAADRDHAGGPIGPFARFLLIVISLLAIWIIARLFLKHLSEDEEEEDDELAPDEESPAEAETLHTPQTPAPAPAPAPEVKNPLEGEPQPPNNEGTEHKG